MIDVRLLGPLEVSVNADEVVIQRNKQRALLALLALHVGEALPSDVLVEELWEGRPPTTARDALQNYVSQLRKMLGKNAIETRPAGYVLPRDATRTDIERFERLVADARAEHLAERRAAMLREALSLWRGPALVDFAYERFASAETTRLEELRATVEEDSVDAELELGRHAEVVVPLEALVERRPYDERARAQLMLALYRSGRQADALDAFRDARQTLAEQLGLEPSPALRELERAILLQEPSLAPGAGALAEDRRRTVTVMSVELLLPAALDPELLRATLVDGIAVVQAVVSRHEGWVTTRAGDELLGIFGVPKAHEDDALRAVRAAVELREALGGDRVRIGVDTGTALTEHGFVTGDVTRSAGRLQRTASPGEIVLGEPTLALIRHAVQGRRARGAFRLRAVRAAEPAVARYADSPLTGRDAELSRLIDEFETMEGDGGPRLVAIVGEPGIGKSRLTREFVAKIENRGRVLTGRCLAYGEGTAFAPLREMLSEVDLTAALAGEEDGPLVGRRVAELVGLEEGVVSVDEGLWAARRLFAALVREGPVVLVLEDLHWAEAKLLDLVEQLHLRIAGPLLVLAIARPELLEQRPGWADDAQSLSPLRDAEIEELVDSLAESLDPQTRARLVARAGGNPLFAEQLLAYAQERGGDALSTLPPTVEALLTSRLDLLEAGVLQTVQRAAVMGREFSRTALLALVPPPTRPALSEHLLELVRRGFVRPTRIAGSDEAFRFHHVLVRDAAYAELTKAERAELHEWYGDWLSEQPEAADEVVGHHLEQAHRYRIELAPADRRARQLAADAGAKLGAAGLRAWRSSNGPATIDLLERATVLLPVEAPLRRKLLCELGIAFFSAGDAARADHTLGAARHDASEVGDALTELRASLELSHVGLQLDPEGKAAELLETAARATPLFEAAGDHRALGRAWLLVGFVHGGHYCQNASWEEAAQRALTHYRRASWPAATPVGQLCAALYYGPAPAADGVRHCHEILRAEGENLSVRAQVLRYQAGLVAMAGGIEAARSASDEARGIFDDLGQTGSAAHSGAVRGDIEMLAGDFEVARRQFETLCHYCERSGEHSMRATFASDLAAALLALGELDEAERWTEVCRRHAATDDIGAQFAWRGIEARVLARRGLGDEAAALAFEAVALAEKTDALNKRAATFLALAEVMSMAGEPARARDAFDRAIVLYEAKGNVTAVERAREALSALHSLT